MCSAMSKLLPSVAQSRYGLVSCFGPSISWPVSLRCSRLLNTRCESTAWESQLTSSTEGDRLCRPPGKKCFSRADRGLVAHRNLSICGVTKRLVSIRKMANEWKSIEGIHRADLHNSAKRRALHRNVRFDGTAMRALMHCDLPGSFNAEPYRRLDQIRRSPALSNSLSVDCIRPDSGYVRGNMRLLPHGLNAIMQRFSDEKVQRIILRMKGDLPCFVVEPRLSVTADERHRLFRGSVFPKISKLHGGGTALFQKLLKAGFYIDRCRFSGIAIDYGPKGGSGPRWNSPTIDHIIPGGDGALENLQLLPSCVNLTKSNLRRDDFPNILAALEFMKTEEYFLTHVPAEWRSAQQVAAGSAYSMGKSTRHPSGWNL